MTTFCKFESLDSPVLFNLLAGIIRLDQAEFARVYQTLRRSFEEKSAAPFEKDYARKSLAVVNPDLLPSRSAVYPGIDLPCWLEAPNATQTIVLLGQDPLRDARYFTPGAEQPPYVVIGTPYSVHSRALWTWHNHPRYWAVIDDLLGAGFALYLTDIWKFWAEGQRAPHASAAHTYRTILRQEVDLLSRSGKPVFVVALGNSAAAALLDPTYLAGTSLRHSQAEVVVTNSMRVIRVLHPSPQNEPILSDYLRANDVDPAKRVAGIAEVIRRAIARFHAT
jgi:hypothetical protein